MRHSGLAGRMGLGGLGRGRRGGVMELISTLLAPVTQGGRGGIGGGVGAPGAGGAPGVSTQPSIMQSLSQALGQYSKDTAAYRGEQRSIESHKLATEKAEREATTAEQWDPLIQAFQRNMERSMGLGGQAAPQAPAVPATPPIPPGQPAMRPPVQSQPLPGSVPGGETGFTPAAREQPTKASIDALKAQPWMAEEFDAMFGPGAAQMILRMGL